MNNFDSKIRPLTRKMIYVSVLLSNHFWTHRHPKRERERERERESVRRESRESELDCAPTPDVLARARLRDHVVKIALVRSCLQDRAAEIVPLRFMSSSFGLDHCRQDRLVKIAPLIFESGLMLSLPSLSPRPPLGQIISS